MSVPSNILQGIYNITNRPDLVTKTTQAAMYALNWAHFGSPSPPGTPPQERMPTGDYSFDIVEATIPIPIDPTTGTNAIAFTLIRPDRFRKMKYAYCDPPTQDEVDITSGVFYAYPDNKKMVEIDPGSLYACGNLEPDKDYYYIAGQNVNFVTKVPRQNLFYAYFQTPSYVDSFIAANFPDMLYAKAAAAVFASNDDNRKTYYEQIACDMLLANIYTSYFSF